MFRTRRTKNESDDRTPIDDDAIVIVDRAVDPYIVMFHDPAGYRAEQFRGLRNKLIAMNPDGAAKSLVVTSAIKGEGKTICAINLAMAFAELERHEILLVDGDLRAPSVERALHLNPGPGLADVLLDRVSADQAIRATGIRSLSVLGAGTRLTGPSEVLTTPRIDQIFDRLKERFRYVIVDTPPVMAATDASVLAARADGSLLAIRLEHSSRQLCRDAIRTLEDLGANVLGSFVTEVRGVDPDRDPRFTYGRDDADDEEALLE